MQQYLRIHISALEAARSPAQLQVIVGLYRLADAQRWQAFPASDRWLSNRLKSSRAIVRRALELLEGLGLLKIVQSGDRENPRIIQISQPGTPTTSQTTSHTTSQTTYPAGYGRDNGNNERPDFEVLPRHRPPLLPHDQPNYHILSTSKPDQSNQKQREQTRGSSRETGSDSSLSVRFSEMIVRVWREAEGGQTVTADQPRAAVQYATDHPKIAQRLCADQDLLSQVIKEHLETAKPSYQNLGALLRFDRINPILSEMVSEKNSNNSRWSRHERQNRKWR